MRMRIWIVWLLLAVLCLAGCGSIAPYTNIGAPRNVDENVDKETWQIEIPGEPVSELPTYGGEIVYAALGCTSDLEPEAVEVGTEGRATITKPDGTVMELPAGTKVTTTHDRTKRASSEASSLSTNQPTEKFETGDAGAVSVSEGAEESGGGGYAGMLQTSTGQLYLLGALCVIAGIVMRFGLKMPMGWSVLGAGVALMGLAWFFSEASGWILGGAMVVAAVVYVLSTKWGKSLLDKLLGREHTLQAIVTGVENTERDDPKAGARVKAAIGDVMTAMETPTETMKGIVKSVKREKGLPS